MTKAKTAVGRRFQAALVDPLETLAKELFSEGITEIEFMEIMHKDFIFGWYEPQTVQLRNFLRDLKYSGKCLKLSGKS